MPRPNKAKKVCRMPACTEYKALHSYYPGNEIILSVEEYETIRLIDYMGLTQEECAAGMDVARSTVQTLYTDARKKIARFLVEASHLKIGGGNYELCPETTGCRRAPNMGGRYLKGDNQMKIAVTYEDGKVFQHFGHSEQFKIYEAKDGVISAAEVVDTNGSGHGALAGFLKEQGVDILICGGIGGGAKAALAEAGIELFAGAGGDADEQVKSFLSGTLNYNPDTECNHHHHHEGGCHSGDHECGHHCR